MRDQDCILLLEALANIRLQRSLLGTSQFTRDARPGFSGTGPTTFQWQVELNPDGRDGQHGNSLAEAPVKNEMVRARANIRALQADIMKQLLLELVPPAAPTFANLEIGVNAEAIAAARAMATGQFGEGVLYIWGEPGSGKSHLCAAMVAAAENAVRMENGSVAASPLGNRLHVVDGVESLDEASQAALFNFFNQRGNAALLMTGSHATRDLPLRRDLATRIGSGLTYQIKPLSDDEKHAALLAHAEARGMIMDAEIANYLLRHGRRDMRSLVAMLDAIDRYSLEAGRPVTLPMVREALNRSQVQS